MRGYGCGLVGSGKEHSETFVSIKSEEQLDLQALHRARERLVQNRTRLVNQARGFLMERGVRVGQGRHVFQRALRQLGLECGA